MHLFMELLHKTLNNFLKNENRFINRRNGAFKAKENAIPKGYKAQKASNLYKKAILTHSYRFDASFFTVHFRPH